MIRALVPVNLRPLEKAYKLGNQFGARLSRPADRHRESGRAAVRGARQHEGAEGQLPAGPRPRSARRDGRRAEAAAGPADHGARAQRDRGDDQRARAAAAALLRGRRDRALHVLGAAVRATSAWACRSCRTPAQVQFGLITDRGLCPDPERVIAQFGAGIREAAADDAARAVAARRRSRSRASRRGRWRSRRTVTLPAARRQRGSTSRPAALLELRARELDVEPFHRVGGLARGRFLVELLGLRHAGPCRTA